MGVDDGTKGSLYCLSVVSAAGQNPQQSAMVCLGTEVHTASVSHRRGVRHNNASRALLQI